MRTRTLVMVWVSALGLAVAAVVIPVVSVVIATMARPKIVNNQSGGPLTPGPGGVLSLDLSKTHLCNDFGWPAGVGFNEQSPGPCRIIARLPGGKTVDMTAQSAMIGRTHDMIDGVLMWLPPQTKTDAYLLAKKLMVEWSLEGIPKLDAWYKLRDGDEHGERRRSFGGFAPGYGYAVQVVPSYSLDLSKPWSVTFSFGFINMYTPYEGDPSKTEHDKPTQELHWDFRTTHTTADVAWPPADTKDYWQIERPTHLIADLPEGRRVDVVAWDVHVVRQSDTVLGFMVTLPAADDTVVVGEVNQMMDQWGISGKEQIQDWYTTPAAKRRIDVLEDIYFLRRFNSFQSGTGIELSSSATKPYQAIFNVSFR